MPKWLHARRATSTSAERGAALVIDEKTREQATAGGDFDPARRLPALRESLDAGANSSVLPILTVASLVGFGAVIAALPAFVVAMNVLAGRTDTASGGMAIALNALGTASSASWLSTASIRRCCIA